MKHTFQLFGMLLLLFIGANVAAQTRSDKDFNNCSAIFLDGKMLVDEYSTKGKCSVSLDAKGKLTLHPVELEEDGSAIPGEKIRFKVALRGKPGDTLMLFSEKTYTEIDISKVLSYCKPGESILLPTLEREWAVSHNVIFIQ